MLEAAGHAVETMSAADAAPALAREHGPDTLILDSTLSDGEVSDLVSLAQRRPRLSEMLWLAAPGGAREPGAVARGSPARRLDAPLNLEELRRRLDIEPPTR
jgi:DNA-binding response OmpR family regulator